MTREANRLQDGQVRRWCGRIVLALAIVFLLAGLSPDARLQEARAQQTPGSMAQTAPDSGTGTDPCGPGGIYTAGPYARCDCSDPSQPCPVICWWSNSAQSVLCAPRQDLYKASLTVEVSCQVVPSTCNSARSVGLPLVECPSANPTRQELDPLGGACIQGSPPLQGGVSENGSGETPLQGGVSGNGSSEQPPINGGVDTGPGPEFPQPQQLCPDGSVPAPDGSCPSYPVLPVQQLCPDGSVPAPDGSCPSSNPPPQQLCPDGSQPASDGSCPAPQLPCQPSQPAPSEDRLGVLAQTSGCTPPPPAPCAAEQAFINASLSSPTTAVPLLTRLCLIGDSGFQATVSSCIGQFQAATGTQAAQLAALLNASSPAFWVLVGPSSRPSSGTVALAPSGGSFVPSGTAGAAGNGANALVLLNASAGNYRDGLARDQCASLIHELQHAVQINAGTLNNTPVTGLGVADPTTLSPLPGVTGSLPQRELDAVTAENCWRGYMGLDLRQRYSFGGQLIILPHLVASPPAETCYPQSPLSSIS